MKSFFKKIVFTYFLLIVFCLFSCGNDEIITCNLYVKKVENISDNFIIGMDTSSVISLEESGVKYYDFDGKEKDVFSILANNGINYIRVRVWNDPFNKDGIGYGGGNCDIQNALKIGKRATKYGMKLIVDFHYSDFWADPGKQMVPKAWAKYNDINSKAEALYSYTKECLELLKNNKVDVGMVQVGNETNGAMCGETSWENICQLMKSGSKAIREVYPSSLVTVHFTNPETAGSYKYYANKLCDEYQLDFDVFGTSYYPYWHGTLDNLTSVLNEVAEKYNKSVMVLENSYAYTLEDSDFHSNTIGNESDKVGNYDFSLQGQVDEVVDVIDAVSKMHNGIGYCYYEGTWISVNQGTYEENKALWEEYGSGWASSYASEYDPNDAGRYYGGCAVENQAFFDKNGNALESLKAFKFLKKGNYIEII